MKIEFGLSANKRNMKKQIIKMLKSKLKLNKTQGRLKKFKFSNHKEDFVITQQEEKEGGFFGSLSYKPVVA
jgi:hypothetical protein